MLTSTTISTRNVISSPAKSQRAIAFMVADKSTYLGAFACILTSLGAFAASLMANHSAVAGSKTAGSRASASA